MSSTTRQAQLFIRKGLMPMASVWRTMSGRTRKMPRLRRSSSVGREKMQSCQTRLTPWLRMVATAAPRMPMPRPQMKRGSRTVLSTTVRMVQFMAARGWPAARRMAFRPK